jgi:DNA-binding NarL/FixJ family response regulator
LESLENITPGETGESVPQARVFVVDNHPIVRKGLSELIIEESDLSVCGEAEDIESALREISELVPDLVILDLSLGEGDPYGLIREIKHQHAEIPILVLTMHQGLVHAERALRAGALGYLTKEDAAENILSAIRTLLNGELYVSEDLSPKLLSRLVGGSASVDENLVENLSDRELQVFRFIGDGKGTREIAEELKLSVKTIETYRANIKQKLGLKNSRELVQQAIVWVLGLRL